MLTEPELNQPIAHAAVSALVALVCQAANRDGSWQAACLLAKVVMDDSRQISAHSFLQQLTSFLEVLRLGCPQGAWTLGSHPDADTMADRVLTECRAAHA